jgi:rhodanese-related sulfurtransferase
MNPPLIFDIRTTDEIKNGRLANSIHVATQKPPLGDAERKALFYKLRTHLDGYSKRLPIYIYCQKGHRSRIAAAYISRLGFYNVTDLGGVEQNPLRGLFRQAQFVRGSDPTWDKVTNSQLRKYQPDIKKGSWVPQ